MSSGGIFIPNNSAASRGRVEDDIGGLGDTHLQYYSSPWHGISSLFSMVQNHRQAQSRDQEASYDAALEALYEEWHKVILPRAPLIFDELEINALDEAFKVASKDFQGACEIHSRARKILRGCQELEDRLPKVAKKTKNDFYEQLLVAKAHYEREMTLAKKIWYYQFLKEYWLAKPAELRSKPPKMSEVVQWI